MRAMSSAHQLKPNYFSTVDFCGGGRVGFSKQEKNPDRGWKDGAAVKSTQLLM